ncbi:response regulator transcription factor [uncultured Oscillibacter sp.]|jgi:DNA-binding response OmpR family regulator|uniref:response regulator transcription factor n=1 Tax=uncultured Oscillibacter sp. TaxID=876091 RepID=UPI0025DFAF4E|nr:response regulator transcription factor [uncultured Oscillibacter sp.]
MKSILIVEDDRALGDGLCLALKGPEAEPALCRTLSAARSALAAGDFDLLVLDVNLPDGNGLDFLRQLRAGGGGIPVILLTANDMETDIVAGLESGADDYVTKPFSLAVLRARVNAQLRRTESRGEGAAVVLDGFSFDFDRMEFRRDGRLVDLSKTEQKLLRVLVENRGRTLPRELLVDRVWTDGAEYVDENALSVTVKRLRGKLEETPSKPRYLKTVYGIGYTWTTGEKEG